MALASRPDVRSVYYARHQREALLFVDAPESTVEAPGTRVPYVPELARYGGPEGLHIAEQVFQADSLPCLDLLAAEARGILPRSLRETSLLLTERLLDLFAFDRQARIAFYRGAYAWALEQGRWDLSGLALLESRYAGLREGLSALLDAAPEVDLEPARPWIDALRQAHAAGRIRQELPNVAWSFAHMQCNRLGIDGDAEAILRFFMQRAHEDGLGKVA